MLRETPLLIVVGFYFLWQTSNNIVINLDTKSVFAQEKNQYLSPNYTFMDVTVLTGEVQKETYAQYTVQKGETVSDIAVKHGLHVASILEVNKISVQEADFITPGTNILIPTEDLSDSNEWIVASNQRIAQEKAEEAKRIATSTKNTRSRTSNTRILSGNYGTNLYPYGYCTWYVASRRSVPRWGNAGSWYYNAKASGYATGHTARPGAIFVSNESPIGHVGIVESVNGSTMVVSEMNYAGYGKVSRRTLPVNFSRIKGFIY